MTQTTIKLFLFRNNKIDCTTSPEKRIDSHLKNVWVDPNKSKMCTLSKKNSFKLIVLRFYSSKTYTSF